MYHVMDHLLGVRRIPAFLADVIFQVEPEIKMFWLPISLLFSSKVILKQLFAEGEVNIGEYSLRRRRSKYWGIFTSPSANNCY